MRQEIAIKPFLKWAGGKRWLLDHPRFEIPPYTGKYIEPFLGGGAVFFHHRPKAALLSDINCRLIETYNAIKDDWRSVWIELRRHHRCHSKQYYYEERSRVRKRPYTRAAQFLYLNRTCWNGLYRENLKGKFNVPVGTKNTVIFDDDNFCSISDALKNTNIHCTDFEETIAYAETGDLLFVDPPYTTAHNMNGFVKYNQKIFSWNDQIRLYQAIDQAVARGVLVIVTNAAHDSIRELYSRLGEPILIDRQSVISGNPEYRNKTSEFLYVFG